MKNPLLLERTPENHFQDIQDLARDLAFGALMGYWDPIIRTFRGVEVLSDDNEIHLQFAKKWIQSDHRKPGYTLLIAMGYVQEIPSTGQYGEFMITEKAYNLLSAPAFSKRIFISYRRRESSAFALLLEARLRNAGANADAIFVDKNMPGGEQWESRIHREIETADYFVCLIGPATLATDSWVLKEIELLKATNPQAIVIPICHNGVRLGQLPTVLGQSNGYEIAKPADEETALDYETAINFILNAIGYKTY